MDELTGQTLGPYEIRERLGSGGMATVYKGYQPSMDREVAIKVLPTQLAMDPNFAGRFTQEAKTIAKLEHPRILPVYDSGQADGIAYIVMRYLNGGSISDMMQTAPPTLAETAGIITQVAEALDYAHARGVIHRDVKPGNIMLDEEGDVYLTDFGIAKLIEGTSQFTGSGIVGTPDYLSPEQGLGTPLDARSDVYSLGVTLYYMAVGRLPFEAETPMAVVIKHINEPLPDPRSQNPDLLPAVEGVIMRALAKDPDDRYQSCGALAKALTTAIDQSGDATVPMPVSAHPLPPTSPPPAPVEATRRGGFPLWAVIASGVIGALVVVGVVGLLLFATRDNRRPDQAKGGLPPTPAAPQNRELGAASCQPRNVLLSSEDGPPEVVESFNAEFTGEGLQLRYVDDAPGKVVFAPTSDAVIVTVAATFPGEDVTILGVASHLDSSPDEEGYVALYTPSEGEVTLTRRGEIVASESRTGIMPVDGRIALQLRTIEGTVQVLLGGVEVLTYTDADPLPAGRTMLFTGLGAVVVNQLEVCQVDRGRTARDVLFEERFTGGTYSPLWEWAGIEPEWRIEDDALRTTIVPGSGVERDRLAVDLNLPVLFITPPGQMDETITLTARVQIRPQENYQGAGIMVVGPNGRPLLQFARAYCAPSEEGCVGDGIYLDPLGADSPARIQSIATAGDSLPAGPILLRLVLEEEAVIALYSTDDGASWQVVDRLQAPLRERIQAVGLYTTAGGEQVTPIDVLFADVQVAVGNPTSATTD